MCVSLTSLIICPALCSAYKRKRQKHVTVWTRKRCTRTISITLVCTKEASTVLWKCIFIVKSSPPSSSLTCLQLLPPLCNVINHNHRQSQSSSSLSASTSLSSEGLRSEGLPSKAHLISPSTFLWPLSSWRAFVLLLRGDGQRFHSAIRKKVEGEFNYTWRQ